MRFPRLIQLLAFLLIPALSVPAPAYAAPRALTPEAVKAKIQSRGVGEPVRVGLADNTNVTGIILTITDTQFTLKIKKIAEPRAIEYAQVTSVQNVSMGGHRKGMIVLAVIGGIVVVPVLIYAIAAATY